MKTRKLGKFEVSAVGMGCMGFSTAYGQTPPKEESIRLMRLAHEMGCTFYDTAEIYAAFRNETLVGEALEPIRDEIVLCTKYSPSPLPGQEAIEGGKFSENGLRAALEGSLKRLRTDRIDLYYIHRIPEGAEMEEIASWFGRLIKEGKILGWASLKRTRSRYAARTAELDKLKVYGVRTDDEIARLGELRKELYGGSGVPFK